MLRVRALAAAGVVATVGAVLPVAATVAAADTAAGPVTVVGGGQGYGGPALSVFLDGAPASVHTAIDPADGSLLIADGVSRVLRVPAAGGNAVVVAGTAKAGYSGDGGPATQAQLQQPHAVVADAAGDIFIAESSHVRKISPDGTITTIAGNGGGYTRDSGVSATSTGVGATSLDLFPDGRLVVGEPTQVRVISTTGVISMFAGPYLFGTLSDVAVAPDGSLFVGDASKHEVDRIAPDSTTPVRVAGTGASSGQLGNGIVATNAQLLNPAALAVASDGTVFVSDPASASVRAFTVGGTISSVVDDNTTPAPCSHDVSIDRLTGDGAILCYASNNQTPPQVLHFSTTGGKGEPWAGAAADATASPDGVTATDARADTMTGSTVDGSGRTWFSGNGLVRYVGDDGALHTASTPATGPQAPSRLAPAGPDAVYAADPAGDKVWRIDVNGTDTVVAGDGTTTYGADGPDATGVGLDAPDGVATAPDGTLYIADTGAGAVRAVDSSGAIRTVFSGATKVTDVAVAADGTVGVVTDLNLLEIAPEGAITPVTSAGSWSVVEPDGNGGWFVGAAYGVHDLQADGSWRPVVELSNAGRVAELTRLSGGALQYAAGRLVMRVDSPTIGAAPASPTTFTATGGPGRITLSWDAAVDGYSLEFRMAPGDVAPKNIWSGFDVPEPDDTFSGSGISPRPVFWSETPHVLLPIGEDYSFSAFAHGYVSTGPSTVDDAWSSAGSSTAAAQPDTTPPAPVSNLQADGGQTNIHLSWVAATAEDDLGQPQATVVRMAVGSTTPPATPTDGVDVPVTYYGAFTDPATTQPDTDYAFSVFRIDLRGNYAPPATVVARLDRTAPDLVTNLVATPSYTNARLAWTTPDPTTDPNTDWAGVQVSYGAGADVPAPPATGCVNSWPTATGNVSIGIGPLAMDSDYTAAVYSCDKHGNMSAPAVVHLHTLLDTTPPGQVTKVVATGGNHSFTVSFTPPTDADYSQTIVRYALGTTPPATPTDGLLPVQFGATPNSRTASNLPGGSTYAISLWTRDTQGLYSDPVHATVTTLPDTTPPPQPQITSVSSPGSHGLYFCYSFISPNVKPADLAGIHISVIDPERPDPNPTDWHDSWVKDLSSAGYGSSGNCTTVTVPTNEKYYDIWIYPYDTTGNVGDGWVDMGMAHALPSQVPSAVPNVTAGATSNDNEIAVGWGTPTTTGGSDINGYRVQVWWSTADGGYGGQMSRDFAGDVHDALLDGLPGGVDLNVDVLASNVDNGWNNVVMSGAVVQATAAALDTLAPSSATSMTASVVNGTAAKLAWHASTSPDVQKYVLVRTAGTTPAASPSSGSVVASADVTSAKSSGLKAGTTYTFTVFARDWAGHVSKGRSVATYGTSLSMKAPTSVHKGRHATLAGQLRRLGSSAGLAHRPVRLCTRRHGAASYTCRSTTQKTTSTGHYSFTVTVRVATDYQVRFAGAANLLASRVTRTVRIS